MKKFMCIVGLMGTLVLLPRAAQAETHNEWTGTEVLTSAQSEFSMFRASVTYFWIPKADVGMFMTYVGPKLELGDWGWISPQVGLASNWKNDTDFFLTSVWGFAKFSDFTLFLEGDYYMAEGQNPDIYSFGALDYNWADYNAGIHSEGVDEIFGFGTHFGASSALGDWGWHGEIQYYVKPTGPPDADGNTVIGHALRVVNQLSF